MRSWGEPESLPMTFGKAALTLAGMAIWGMVIITVVVRLASK